MKTKLSALLLLFSLGISAQSNYSNRNLSHDTSEYEKVLAHWNTTMNEVKSEVQASDTVFYMFTNYCSSQLDSIHHELFQQAGAGSLGSANINTYMQGKKHAIKKLYATFQSVYNNYSNAMFPPLAPKFLPSYTPPSCDTACTNMDFATADFTGWYGYYAQNNSNTSISISGITGGYLGSIQKGAYDPISTTYQIHMTSSPNVDWFLNTYPHVLLSQASPFGSGYSAMIGDSTATGAQVAILSQEFNVTPSTNSITYSYAVFLENPGHSYYQQPFFIVTLLDQNGDTIPGCGEYKVFAQPGNPGFKAVWNPLIGDSSYYKPWSEVNVPLTAYQGQCVTLIFEVADCALGGHAGYAYVDASCAQLQIIPATPTGIICGKNGTLTLDGPGGEAHYSWTGPNLPNPDTLQNVNVDSVATYTLVVTPYTGAGCNDTLKYTVKGRDTIKAVMSIPDNILCFGGKGEALATEANGLGPFTYQWLPAGGNNALATGLSAGTYSVTITDSNGCEATGDVTLTQPTRIALAVTYTVATCNMNNGAANVNATGGTSPYTYQWSPGGYTNAHITGLSAGIYTITVTDKNGCTSTASANIAQSDVLATISSSINVSCYGENNGQATVGVAGGITPYTYRWNPSGQTTVTATGLSAGTYTITVTDASGCSSTAAVSITQPAKLIAPIGITNPILCYGETGSATVTAGGGTSPYTYRWNPSGQTTATANGLTSGVYTITVTDKNGCTATNSINITQPAVLAINPSYTHAACSLPNLSASANASGGTSPYTYRWTPGGQTTASATGLSVGTYTISVTDNNHCSVSAALTITQPTPMVTNITATTNDNCYGQSNGNATVTVSGGILPYAYLWAPAGGNGAVGTGLTAGTYTVTIKDANGCTESASTIITQPSALNINITGPQIRCLGDKGNFTANVTGGTSPYVYSWAGNGVFPTNAATVTILPPGNQTYTLTVTDAHGCVGYQYISFSFPPPLAVTATSSEVTCSGRSASLCATATGGTGGDTYFWAPVNLTSPCVTIPVSLATIYTITVTDNCSVTASATTSIRVNPPPAVNFTSNAIQGCEPLCVQFRNLTASTGGKEEYIWNFGNGDSLLEENPIFCYTSNGVFNVTLTVISDSGCSSTLSKIGMITVYNRPVASFTYSPQQVTILSPTVQFTDKSNDLSGIIYRLWNFGDGRGDSSASNLQDPTHTYSDTGNYCASLIVMDAHGCTDTTTNCLVIAPQYNLYIPSAFTPNGDGIDDQFKPVGQYIKSFDMYIFDRWGLQLYHTTDINKGWDGTVHGSGRISQEDTYIYKITVTDAQDNQHSYIGNVTLLK